MLTNNDIFLQPRSVIVLSFDKFVVIILPSGSGGWAVTFSCKKIIMQKQNIVCS